MTVRRVTHEAEGVVADWSCRACPGAGVVNADRVEEVADRVWFDHVLKSPACNAGASKLDFRVTFLSTRAP